MTEDRELIKQTLAGERGAFDEIVARYQDGLYRHLLRLCGRPEEAEDLCQESFIRLYRSLRRFNPERPLIPFLFTIATNVWRKRLGRAGREVALSYEAADAGGDPVSEKVFSRLEHQQVLAAVARLQPEQREAVSLFYDQGLSYREISGITGAPVGTVSTRLKRALETLRQALAAGLVLPGVGDLPQHLTSILQGQGAAPGSIGPAVAHGISTLAPAGVGLLALWKEAGVMMKGIYVAIGLAVVGGATLGVPRLMSHSDAAPTPAQVEVGKAAAEAPGKITEFSGDLVVKLDKKSVSSTIQVKGLKSRIAFDEEGRKSIQIWRHDKHLAWMLNPADKTYTTVTLTGDLNSTIEAFSLDNIIKTMGGPEAVTKQLLGEEKVNGYLCDKYSLTPVDKNNKNRLVVWVAKQLSMAVRVEGSDGKVTTQNDLKNIRVGNVPDALFEVPEGYKLQSGAQAGPADKQETATAAPEKASASQPVTAAWERIQADVAYGLASEGYREGERIAAEAGPPPEPNTLEGQYYGSYLLVNFAHSLSRGQYEVMKKNGKLSYATLTQQQQNILFRLAEMKPDSPLQTHQKKSSIMITEFPESIKSQRPGELMFMWESGNNMMMANF
jgi:RNA polymerase sigma-70 factor, ECF subfamily